MKTPHTGYELREHTADIALYVWADQPETLFVTAARGFYAAIGDLAPGGEAEPLEIALTAPDRADLLGDFLAELLFIFETRHAQVTDIDIISLGQSELHARCQLRPVNMKASEFDLELKAVTRHNLAITAENHPYEATIILDI